MSDYPSWWDTTVTLYNKYTESNGAVTWYRTVLEGCFWKYIGDRVRVNDSVLSTEDTVCRIRKNEDYRKPHEWKNADDKSSVFTINRGDIIVCGEVEDEINEYQKGSRSSDLINKYRDEGCIEVVEWANNTGGGRGIEHYRVKGI